MKPFWKCLLWLLASAAMLASAGVLFVYFEVFRPQKVLADLHARQVQGEKVDPKILRKAAHKALRWVAAHDAFLTLEECGDESSIPVLIRSLRRVDKPDPESGGVICTSGHCLDALRKVTGVNYGFDADTWETWWKQHKKEPVRSETNSTRAAAGR